MSLWPDSLQLGEPTRCFHSWIFCALVAVVACYVLSTNIVDPFEYVFPKCSTCYYKKFSKNHQCGFIHAFKHLMLSICSYIESSWMDYLQCGFFHVSSNGLILNSHTGSNWMIYHCCGSFQVSSKCLMFNIFVTLRAAEWFITSVGSFMSLQMAWYWTFEVPLGANECFFTGVNSFMSLQCLMLRNGSNWMVYHLCGFFLVQVQNQFMCFVFHVENWTDIQI